mgnify:CR=1 FL=1
MKQRCNIYPSLNIQAMKKNLIHGINEIPQIQKRRQNYETHRSFNVGTQID